MWPTKKTLKTILLVWSGLVLAGAWAFYKHDSELCDICVERKATLTWVDPESPTGKRYDVCRKCFDHYQRGGRQ